VPLPSLLASTGELPNLTIYFDYLIRVAAPSPFQRAGRFAKAPTLLKRARKCQHIPALPRSRFGRGPFTRTGHGQFPASSVMSYLTLALCASVPVFSAAGAFFSAAAATAEGSAKATTASPSSKL
jgi:hypothetical protein